MPRLDTRVDAAVISWLEAYAERHGVSRSDVVRNALEIGIRTLTKSERKKMNEMAPPSAREDFGDPVGARPRPSMEGAA